MPLEPLHFQPILKPVVWGGNKIAAFKGISTSDINIGESWEISTIPGSVSVVDRGPHKGKSICQLIDEFGPELLGDDIYGRFGNEFPLLVKFIDTKENLSVQVHPTDRIARHSHGEKGKTEMWHIIQADDNAKIYLGIKDGYTPDKLRELIDSGNLMDAVKEYDSKEGQSYFIPAGTVHSIGGGNLLAEIQQNSDITYRLYDYNRTDKSGNKRPLHIDQALNALDFNDKAFCIADTQSEELVSCTYFTVKQIQLTGNIPTDLKAKRGSFLIVMCISGTATINSEISGNLTIKQGETYLIPASNLPVSASGVGKLLTAQV